MNSYQEMQNRLLLYCEFFSLLQSSMFDFSLSDAKAFKDWMLNERDLSPKTVNNTISHLAMFWDRAIEEQLTEQNPFKLLTKVRLKDKPMAADAHIRFEPITDSEMKQIFTELRAANQHDFIRFLLFVYYAWARPVELLKLKSSIFQSTLIIIIFFLITTYQERECYQRIIHLLDGEKK